MLEKQAQNRLQPEILAEKRLVARFQSGEAEALGALFEIHVDRVFAFALHLTNNRSDAEEITSEAFLRAFERAAQYRGECPFRGWLFGITRNLCRDRMRQPRLLSLESEDLERQLEGENLFSQLETRVQVRQAVAELPEDQRLVLLLCDVEEWDAKEVAVVIEKTLVATKSLLYRARKSLKNRLVECWAEEEERENKKDMEEIQSKEKSK